MMSHPIYFIFSPHTTEPVYQASLKPMFFNSANPKYEGVGTSTAPRRNCTKYCGSGREVGGVHKTSDNTASLTRLRFFEQHAILKLGSKCSFARGWGGYDSHSDSDNISDSHPAPLMTWLHVQLMSLVSIMLTTAHTTLRRSRRGHPMAQSWVTAPHAKGGVDCLLDWLLVVTLGRG